MKMRHVLRSWFLDVTKGVGGWMRGQSRTGLVPASMGLKYSQLWISIINWILALIPEPRTELCKLASRKPGINTISTKTIPGSIHTRAIQGVPAYVGLRADSACVREHEL